MRVVMEYVHSDTVRILSLNDHNILVRLILFIITRCDFYKDDFCGVIAYEKYFTAFKMYK